MKKIFILILSLLALWGCSNDDFKDAGPLTKSGHPSLDASVNFLKLVDDSTNVAGVLEIYGNAPEVELKWNVDPEFNIDTTLTKLSMVGGSGKLSIKWNKRMNGIYGPTNMGYCGGVQISSKEFQKYIPLVWADKVDSVKMASYGNVKTRAAGDAMPRVNKITVTPNLLELTAEDCGSVVVDFPGTECYVDPYNLIGEVDPSIHHIDIDKIPGSLEDTPSTITFEWDNQGPPTEDFMAHVGLMSSEAEYTKYIYMRYKPLADAFWKIEECIPDTLSTLPATGATVIVSVNTNRKWSIESTLGDPVLVESSENASGKQALVIKIKDNDTQGDRPVFVTVKSSITAVQDTILQFTQSGLAGKFEIVSVVPDITSKLTAAKQSIVVNVNTSRPWWIQHEGKKYYFLSDNSSGSVEIPANTGKDEKSVVITVGYDNTEVGVYKYTQSPGEGLAFIISSLPSGNIPVAGDTYTFTFQGDYSGELQILAIVDSDEIVGVPATNLIPTVTVPSNSASLSTRNVQFKYRMGTGEWIDLNLRRTQDAATIGTKIVLPGVIPREGGKYSCIFSGSYNGPVKLRATVDGTEIVIEGNAPGEVEIEIPKNTGMFDRTIPFEYQLAGSTTWVKIIDKTQSAGTLNFGPVSPTGIIPAKGGVYTCSAEGTYPGVVYFRAITANDEILDDQENRISFQFSLNIPENKESDQRNVIFQYSRDNVEWFDLETRIQSKNVNVDGSQTNTEGFGNEDKTDIEVEL